MASSSVASPKRRRFQAPLTSFFTTSGPQPSEQSSSSSSSPSPANLRPATTAAAGAGPAQQQIQIQASLLTVGMRIRKSVAEGYRTHNKTGHIFTDDGVPASTGGRRAYDGGGYVDGGGAAPTPPWWDLSIHRVGGLAVQAQDGDGDGVVVVVERGVRNTAPIRDHTSPRSNKRAFATLDDDDHDTTIVLSPTSNFNQAAAAAATATAAAGVPPAKTDHTHTSANTVDRHGKENLDQPNPSAATEDVERDFSDADADAAFLVPSCRFGRSSPSSSWL